jgi:hypothetical protein
LSLLLLYILCNYFNRSTSRRINLVDSSVSQLRPFCLFHTFCAGDLLSAVNASCIAHPYVIPTKRVTHCAAIKIKRNSYLPNYSTFFLTSSYLHLSCILQRLKLHKNYGCSTISLHGTSISVVIPSLLLLVQCSPPFLIYTAMLLENGAKTF